MEVPCAVSAGGEPVDPRLAWRVRVEARVNRKGHTALYSSAPMPSMSLTALATPSSSRPRQPELWLPCPSEPACRCCSLPAPLPPHPHHCLELFCSRGAHSAPSAGPAALHFEGHSEAGGEVEKTDSIQHRAGRAARNSLPEAGLVSAGWGTKKLQTQHRQKSSPLRVSLAWIFRTWALFHF